jgi:hypothetical protein
MRYSALDTILTSNNNLPSTLQHLADEYKKTVTWSSANAKSVIALPYRQRDPNLPPLTVGQKMESVFTFVNSVNVAPEEAGRKISEYIAEVNTENSQVKGII